MPWLPGGARGVRLLIAAGYARAAAGAEYRGRAGIAAGRLVVELSQAPSTAPAPAGP